MSRKASAGRRAEIERVLTDQFNVGYEYLSSVPTDEFDIEKSLANQARFEPLDEETVQTYQEAIERGDEFPAVIAHRPGRAAHPKLVIIDGNHRLVAHDRAGVPIDVYEVDRLTKAPTIVLMTYVMNTKHGRPTSEDERIAHAVYLVDNDATKEHAAATMNVPMRLLNKALQKVQADRRADEVGIDAREWDALPQTSRSRLLQISTDEGFKDATHLAFQARLGSDDVQELVALLNASGRSGNKHRAIVKAQREVYAERIQDVGSGVLGRNGSGRKPLGPKTRLAMILGQVTAMPDDIGVLVRSYGAGERAEAAQRIASAAERLHKVALALSDEQA